MTLLGDASYSIYLIQVFTIPVFYKLAAFLRLPSSQADLLALMCLGITAFSGLVSYWLLERSFNKKLRS
jgi:exopolysaccharide production protein ExoZ